MITVKNLYKHYQVGARVVCALDNINLNVPKGSIFGVIGKSGAGKSTLLRCLNGLEQPSSGQVLINSTNITPLNHTQLRAQRRKMGMIFQHFNLMHAKNVYQNIALPLQLQGKSTQQIRLRVEHLLELTQTQDLAQQYPSQLSGGQKQRVAIARALANEPDILLSDEATSALDPVATAHILDLLQQINTELGITIFLITHEMDVVKRLCDRVAVMESGKVVEEQNTLKLFADPKHLLAQEFVKQTFQLAIPADIEKRLTPTPGQGKHCLVQISYHGNVADQPIISHLQQAYQIHANILQGKIETVQNQTIGQLLIEIQGCPIAQQSSIDYLQKTGLKVKTLGYVQRD